MSLIRVEIKGTCDCGKPLVAEVGLVRGGQSSVPCSCGFSLMVTAPKEKSTRVGINPMTNDVTVLQVGDDDDEPESEPDATKH